MGEMKLEEKEVVVATPLSSGRAKPRDRRSFVRGPPLEQRGFLTPSQSLVMFALRSRDPNYWTPSKLASLFAIDEAILSCALTHCHIPIVTSAARGQDIHAMSSATMTVTTTGTAAVVGAGGGTRHTTVAQYLVSLTNANNNNQPVPTIGRSVSSGEQIGRPMAFR
jgi:hypothetical protein